MKERSRLQWGKVFGGGAMLLLGGGLTFVFLLFGRLSIWGLVIAVGGICALIDGLFGEDPTW